MHEVVQWLSERQSLEVDLFCRNGFDLNHIIYSRGGKNDRHMLCRKRLETVLLVNCHNVTGRIFSQWISRQTVMKSPLKWHNQPGKKRTFRKSIFTLTIVYEAFTSFNWLLCCQMCAWMQCWSMVLKLTKVPIYWSVYKCSISVW